ncbi:MAG: hypothetical protein M1401_04030 [Chloroflexi bacterium]|nr:hypothetical protein [Chloroflexota bacterium]MCL5108027.1 hypothetical protein [Chloroflexota bacterium]
MASYHDLVTQVIREASRPLTLDEVLHRVGQLRPVLSANPKITIRNALNSSQAVAFLGSGRTAEVKQRCRTALQARADALAEATSPMFSQADHVDPTLALV